MTKEIEVEGFGAFAEALEGIYNRPAIPATTGATTGDVLTLGSDGPEWATPAAGHDYSITERKVGTWIDGNTIFERSYIYETPVSIVYQTWNTTDIDVTGISSIIDMKLFIRSENGTYTPLITKINNGVLSFYSFAGWNYDVLVIQYTKTTV